MEMHFSTERSQLGELESEPGRPLVRPAPRSAMFFPLVVLAAVLPGLYALNWWNLTPPGPWWGLRGQAVVDGWIIDQAPAARHFVRPWKLGRFSASHFSLRSMPGWRLWAWPLRRITPRRRRCCPVISRAL